jgi:hypothetical protein
MARARRRNGRNRPRIPTNLVYRTIQASGGPTAVLEALGIADATLKRWRRSGEVLDARAVLTWAALVHPVELEAQLRLARRLCGLPPLARPRGRRHAEPELGGPSAGPRP